MHIVSFCLRNNADGIRLKRYRGMGSIEAMTRGSEKRYFATESAIKVAQGVAGAVSDKGSLLKYLPFIVHGVKAGLFDIGTKSLDELHAARENGTLRAEFRSPAAQIEGGVHSVHSVIKKA
jgi:IMP dehydrogenase